MAVATRTPIVLIRDDMYEYGVVEVWQRDGVYHCTCVDSWINSVESGDPADLNRCKHIEWVEAQLDHGFWRYTFDSPVHEVKADSPETLRDWLLQHLHIFSATEMT